MFDQYFDSILYSEKDSRLKRIVQSTISGVYNFVNDGDMIKSIKMMNIMEDF